MSALGEAWMDDLEIQLSGAAARVCGQARARRRRRRIGGLAIAAVVLVGAGALAATTPFHPIASFHSLTGAQRVTHPGDAVEPALLRGLRGSPWSPVEAERARLLATFAGGERLYAAPGKGGLLCLILSLSPSEGGGSTCGAPLGPSVPLMALVTVAHAGAGPVMAGLARDDVRAIVLTVGGVPLTVPVHDNAFLYRGAPFTGIARSAVIELRDGTVVGFP
jgi:hypothetical protein